MFVDSLQLTAEHKGEISGGLESAKTLHPDYTSAEGAEPDRFRWKRLALPSET